MLVYLLLGYKVVHLEPVLTLILKIFGARLQYYVVVPLVLMGPKLCFLMCEIGFPLLFSPCTFSSCTPLPLGVCLTFFSLRKLYPRVCESLSVFGCHSSPQPLHSAAVKHSSLLNTSCFYSVAIGTSMLMLALIEQCYSCSYGNTPGMPLPCLE